MTRRKGTFKAVILAGGSGERFWPLSTSERPKQFLDFFGGSSLLRQSVSRLAGLVAPEDIYVVTAQALVRATRRELPEIAASHIIGEPIRRDTGAAVATGLAVTQAQPDDVVAFFPADQLVADIKGFQKALRQAVHVAQRGDRIVTLGIRPNHPATGFGYINPKSGSFVEKPNVQTARRYVRQGYLWNAGMFIARAAVFDAAFAEYAPSLLPLVRQRPTRARLAALYPTLPRISFDYAVMEKLPRVEVVAGDFGWDDVGGYGAFDRYYPHDVQGNVSMGDCTLVDAADNVCVSQERRIALLGVKGLVVVSTPHAVLVAAKDRVSEMKRLFQQKPTAR